MIVINNIFYISEFGIINVILMVVIIIPNLIYFILQLLKFIKKLIKSENIIDFIFIIIIDIN